MINVAQDLGVEVPTSEEVDEVLKELDKNGDGKLSIDEIQVFIESVLEMMAKFEK
jgi:calmodulin